MHGVACIIPCTCYVSHLYPLSLSLLSLFSPLLSTLILSILLLDIYVSCKQSPLPEGFVFLADVSDIVEDIRYATYHNFMGRPSSFYLSPRCILSNEAAKALINVQEYVKTLPPPGPYSLKVYDCYRPTTTVQEFVDWSEVLNDTLTKLEFYPDLDKSVLFEEGYIAYNSSHSRGSTMDLTLIPLGAPPDPPYTPGQPLHPCYGPYDDRFADNSIDMGSGFDCFSEVAHTNYTDIGVEQIARRMLLQYVMEQIGDYINYAGEWWHFTLRNEPYPDTYFNFSIPPY